jgi:ABC-type Na+ efflux pump permease subunit
MTGMVGSIFFLELLRGSRRGWQHWFRWGYGGGLLLELFVVVLMVASRYAAARSGVTTFAGAAEGPGAVVGWFVALLVAQQAVLTLSLPAFAAASLGEEKARGTLQEMLTTELTGRDVVLGKLLGQVVRVLDLSLPGWLMLAFAAGAAGVEPRLLLAFAVSLVVPLPALAALGLLAAVRCRRTPNAVGLAYAVTGAWLALLALLGVSFPPLGPAYAVGRFLTNTPAADLLAGVGAAAGVWGLLGVAAAAVAAWQLRPAYLGQLEQGPARPRGALAGSARPPVSDSPLRWKECHVQEETKIPLLRRIPRRYGPWMIFALALVWNAVLAAICWTFQSNGSGQAESSALFALQGLVVLVVLSQAVGSKAATSVSGERERQTWEALLLTPLTARQILRGKLWGILDSVRPLLFAYTLAAVPCSLAAGVGPFLWTVTTWAGTWVTMYYMGAVGLAGSVHTDSTWRSILTLVWRGYRGLLLRGVFLGLPGGLLGYGAAMGVLSFLPGSWSWAGDVAVQAAAWCGMVTGGLFLFAHTEELLMKAEEAIGGRDRPVPRPPRWRQSPRYAGRP